MSLRNLALCAVAAFSMLSIFLLVQHELHVFRSPNQSNAKLSRNRPSYIPDFSTTTKTKTSIAVEEAPNPHEIEKPIEKDKKFTTDKEIENEEPKETDEPTTIIQKSINKPHIITINDTFSMHQVPDATPNIAGK